MKYRTYTLAAAALACAAALAFLASQREAPRRAGLVAVAPPVAEAPNPAGVPPGEFTGRIGPVVMANPPQPAPELKFADGAGREVALADFHGRALLVNLWATWCVPCVEELPALDRLQARLGGREFEVIALSVDREGRSVVAPFLDKLAIKSLAHYVDSANVATRTLKIRGLPTTLLIDADGRELGRLEGAASWDTPVAEAFLRRVLLPRGPG